MKLIFERSVPGRRCSILPACDVEETPLPESLRRAEAPVLPELSEQDLSRHYTELNHHVHGVNCGFYPLGSCTMKYNPRINEEMAALPGFTGIHPLAPAHTVQGCRRVLELAQQYLCEITGMDGMTFRNVMPSMPVISHRYCCASSSTRRQPCTVWAGASGWMPVKPGSAAISSLIRGLYFMVQEPSG